MASGIPPLLPASPPPMCEIDFDEDDIDNDENEDDDFGDFSTATAASDSGLKHDSNILLQNQNHYDYISEPPVDTNIDERTVLNERTVSNPIIINSVQDTSVTNTSHNDDETVFASFVSPSMDEKHGSNISPNVLQVTNIDMSNGTDSDCDNLNSKDNSIHEHSSSLSSKSVSVDDFSIELVLPSCDTTDKLDDNTSENVYDIGFCVSDAENIYCERDHSSSSAGENADRTNIELEFDTVEDLWNEHPEVEEASLEKVQITEAVEPVKVNFNNNVTENFEKCRIPNIIVNECVNSENENTFSNVNDDFFVTSSSANIAMLEAINSEQKSDIKYVKQEDLSACVPDLNQLNFNDDNLDGDDDDFSDFISPSNFVSNEENFSEGTELPSHESWVDSNSEQQPVDYDVEESWGEIFNSTGQDKIEVNLNTIEGRLNGSSVWCEIKDVQSSPALNYTWAESEANKMLLSTLYVDTRNILFGPKWNSEVPRFASNLGFTPLVPQKTSGESATGISPAAVKINLPKQNDDNTVHQPSLPSNVEFNNSTKSKVLSSVPDAHFDWNNSGLTNPLDNRKSPVNNGKADSDSNYRNFVSTAAEMAGSTFSARRPQPSREAENILNNLPNLLVMEKQYIVFPLR